MTDEADCLLLHTGHSAISFIALDRWGESDPLETVVIVFNNSNSSHSRIKGYHTAPSTISIQPDPIDSIRTYQHIS
jgi:hypothetical protein